MISAKNNVTPKQNKCYVKLKFHAYIPHQNQISAIKEEKMEKKQSHTQIK